MEIEISPINAEIICNLHCFFQNFKKVSAWMSLKNNNFGGASPIQLIKAGRGKKVLDFIIEALDNDKSL